MPTPIDRGTDDPLLQQRTWHFDPQSGQTYSEEWRGMSVAKMQAKANGLILTAQRAKIVDRHGSAELMIEWGGSDGGMTNTLAVTFDRWEVPDPTEQRDLFQHPEFLAVVDTFANDTNLRHDCIAIIRRYAEAAKSAGTSVQTISDMMTTLNDYLTTVGGNLPWDAEPWLKFYRLYANNQTHYQDHTYALRHTTNAPAFWSYNVADSNINRILTHAQFLSEIGNVNLWNYPCPGRIAHKLTAAYADFVASHWDRTNFLCGWLKGPTSEATVGRGRIELQTTYKLDQWGIPPYAAAS